MTETRALLTLLTVCAFAAASASGAPVDQSGRAAATAADYDRLTLSVPSPDRRTPMRTTVLRPKGAGPFPLVIVNHGSTQNATQRAKSPPPSYSTLSQWFVRRGYVVALPQRPGHGKTGGPYLEDQ